MFGLSLSSLGVKLGIVAGIALFAFVSGWRVESWRWGSADAEISKANAAKIVAIEKQYSDASNSDWKQINDLNSRLTSARQKLASDHITGACFDAGVVRDLNSAIAGQASAAR